MPKPKRTVYRQIAVIPENGRCPFCHGQLIKSKAYVLLHIPGPPIQRKVIEPETLFCNRCHVHVVTSLQNEAFIEKYGGGVIELPPYRKQELEEAKERMFGSTRPKAEEKTDRTAIRQPARRIPRNNAPTMIIGGRTLELYDPGIFNWKNAIADVYLSSDGLSMCPKCGAKRVHPYNFPVRLKKPDKCVKIEGYACYHCNIGFSAQVRLLGELERIRNKDDGYVLHRDFFIEPQMTRESRRRFEQSETAYCQVTLYSPGDVRVYTVEKKRSKCDGEWVIHYTDEDALAILTALYLEEPKIELGGKQYVIGSCTYAKARGKFYLSADDTVEVTARKGGGYYSADEGTEQLDALVFCHNSRRLEVLPVSFDKKTGQYFVDSTILRGFYQKHGIPFVKYSQKIRNELVPLRDESYLHALGYNVGEQAGLNDDQRQRILADAADAGMPIQDIRRMLDFLINLNRSKEGLRSACEKWQADKEFISSYKINQDNFVFAGKVRRIKQLG